MLQHDGCHGKTSGIQHHTRLAALTDNKQLTDRESRGAHPVARHTRTGWGGEEGGNLERERLQRPDSRSLKRQLVESK